ncbi:hypothetical protein Tco_0829927 [Tanacetum coccineum]
MNFEPLSLADSSPTFFDRLLKEIRAFSQHENESLTDDWFRMKEMLRNCHGHNLSKGNIIKIFYHGLNEITQEVLNATAGGIFLYKTPNQAYQLLKDKVLLKLDWAKNQNTKSSLKKTVAFVDEAITYRIPAVSFDQKHARFSVIFQASLSGPAIQQLWTLYLRKQMTNLF